MTRPHTLFYCDLPYWGTEDYGMEFVLSEYVRMAELAGTIQGKMIISVNDMPKMREIFVGWYNVEHKHSGIKYVTPDERHRGINTKILTARKEVYKLARQQHLERWGKEIRNWSPIHHVYLIPEKEAA